MSFLGVLVHMGSGHTAQNLNEILEAERPSLLAYVRGVVRDEAIAEDLTQEAMLRAHLGVSGLRDRDRFLPWLYRIATNVCRDHFRKQKRAIEQIQSNDALLGPQDLRDENAPQLDKVIECAEMGQCVRRYFDGLSNSYRAVIILHDLEGMTNPEIAHMLGISLDATKVRLHRARKQLRKVLEHECDFYVDERGVLVCEPKEGGMA